MYEGAGAGAGAGLGAGAFFGALRRAFLADRFATTRFCLRFGAALFAFFAFLLFDFAFFALFAIIASRWLTSTLDAARHR